MAITRLGPNNSTNISGVNLTSQVTGTLPTANGGTGATSFAPGKVLQVVQGTTTTSTSTTSTTYADTTLSGAITPSATSSKILVIANQDFRTSSNTDRAGGTLRILRDSTVVYAGDAAYETFFETQGSNAMQIYFRQSLK